MLNEKSFIYLSAAICVCACLNLSLLQAVEESSTPTTKEMSLMLITRAIKVRETDSKRQGGKGQRLKGVEKRRQRE